MERETSPMMEGEDNLTEMEVASSNDIKPTQDHFRGGSERDCCS